MHLQQTQQPFRKVTMQTTNHHNPVESGKEHARGIFLHTGWRSAGTWVWSRFRKLESVNALYEPLSATVSELSAATISSMRPVHSSGHPPLHAPYFEEYRPLLQANALGISGYRKDFGIDRFGDVPDDGFAALQSYLRHLCDDSTNRGKIPVLKFCRSQGRTAWLKHAFPDVLHAGVLRNPASQFASGWLLKQEWGNPYFVAAPFRVLGLNQNEPLVREVIATCGVRLPPAAPSSQDAYAAACNEYVRTVDGSDAYTAFVALWVLNAWRMLDHVDLIIDTDRLGQSPDYATEVSAQFQARTGICPHFNDARNLVDESRRGVRRVVGIDGRIPRPVHSLAQRFLLAHMAKSGNQRTDIVELVRQKLSVAAEISGAWRYLG